MLAHGVYTITCECLQTCMGMHTQCTPHTRTHLAQIYTQCTNMHRAWKKIIMLVFWNILTLLWPLIHHTGSAQIEYRHDDSKECCMYPCRTYPTTRPCGHRSPSDVSTVASSGGKCWLAHTSLTTSLSISTRKKRPSLASFHPLSQVQSNQIWLCPQISN